MTRMPRRTVRFAPLLLLLPLAGCAVSEDEEIALGQQTAGQIAEQLPLVEDPAVVGYVQDLGMRLVEQTDRRNLDWRFHVVNSGEINAFAVPGGYIYLNRGLIERMERFDELAGVLGHEVNHVVLRHSAEQMEKAGTANTGLAIVCSLTEWCQNPAAQVAINVAGSAWFARHSREDEAEADSAAVLTLVRAGIDPDGVASMFERLLEARERTPAAVETWFGSHPLEEDRVAATRRQIEQLDATAGPASADDEAAFQAFRERVAALPPPPPPPAAPLP